MQSAKCFLLVANIWPGNLIAFCYFYATDPILTTHGKKMDWEREVNKIQRN